MQDLSFKELHRRRLQGIGIILGNNPMPNLMTDKQEEHMLKQNLRGLDPLSAQQELLRIEVLKKGLGFQLPEAKRKELLVYGGKTKKINVIQNPIVMAINNMTNKLIKPELNQNLPPQFARYQFIYDIAKNQAKDGYINDTIVVIDMKENEYNIIELNEEGIDKDKLTSLANKVFYNNRYIVLYVPKPENIYEITKINKIARYNSGLEIIDDTSLQLLQQQQFKLMEMIEKYNELVSRLDKSDRENKINKKLDEIVNVLNNTGKLNVSNDDIISVSSSDQKNISGRKIMTAVDRLPLDQKDLAINKIENILSKSEKEELLEPLDEPQGREEKEEKEETVNLFADEILNMQTKNTSTDMGSSVFRLRPYRIEDNGINNEKMIKLMKQFDLTSDYENTKSYINEKTELVNTVKSNDYIKIVPVQARKKDTAKKNATSELTDKGIEYFKSIIEVNNGIINSKIASEADKRKALFKLLSAVDFVSIYSTPNTATRRKYLNRDFDLKIPKPYSPK